MRCTNIETYMTMGARRLDCTVRFTRLLSNKWEVGIDVYNRADDCSMMIEMYVPQSFTTLKTAVAYVRSYGIQLSEDIIHSKPR